MPRLIQYRCTCDQLVELQLVRVTAERVIRRRLFRRRALVVAPAKGVMSCPQGDAALIPIEMLSGPLLEGLEAQEPEFATNL
jgi:hypothetical protein